MDHDVAPLNLGEAIIQGTEALKGDTELAGQLRALVFEFRDAGVLIPDKRENVERRVLIRRLDCEESRVDQG